MAAKIRRRIRLAEFFSADIRRTKIRRLIRIFGGGLGVRSAICRFLPRDYMPARYMLSSCVCLSVRPSQAVTGIRLNANNAVQ